MKRRLISLLLALVMILALLPVQAFAVDPANPFRDVKRGDWCYEAVQYVRVNGFFNGTTRTTFSPNDTMTRGMFVTALGRLAGVDTSQYQGPSAFTDVPEDAYFAPYVAWAAKHGITTGTGDGRFSPYAPINRQQMAAFFVRYFDAFGVDYTTGQNVATTPADMESVSSYARDAVRKLWQRGLLNGDGVNFNPTGNATRAQAATVCWRLDRTVETWYKEPGVASERVKLDPATGLPYSRQQPTRPTETRPASGENDSDSGGGSDSGGDTPGGNTPGGNTPGGNTPGGDTPGGNTPGGDTPGENIPGGDTPGENTPGGDTPGENIPGDDTPGENTPGDDTPGENTPGGNTPGGNTSGGSGSNRLSVSFFDGSRLIESISGQRGQPLGKIPSAEKASKAGAVLTGWYTDQTFTKPFYADDPIQESQNVYAKYEELEAPEEVLTPSSFAQMDQSPDLSFRIRRISGSVEPMDAAELKVMDGSEAVALSVIPEGASAPEPPAGPESPEDSGTSEPPETPPAPEPPADPESSEDSGTSELPETPPAPAEMVCTVRGNPGFNEGCTYELTLAEGWVFVDERTGENKPESIRTATFSIRMEEVHNLRMNSAIQYVQDGGETGPAENLIFTIEGNSYDVLNTNSVNAMGENGTGTFTYAKSNDLQSGDILCVYMGTRPDERRTGAEASDPAAYVKVLNVDGDTVAFKALDKEEQQNLYEIPDNFPLLLSSFPEEGNTVSIDNLDTELYALMMGAKDGTPEKARERLSVGDFVTLYTAESFEEQRAVYGLVQHVDGNTITYVPTTEDAMLHSMDLYDQLEVADGEEWVSEELQEELEGLIQAQVEQSGFAEEAAGLLSDVVAATDGFQENKLVQQSLHYAQGASARSGGMRGFTLANRPRVTVDLLTRGSQMHFSGGVQLRITVEAKYRTPIGESSDDFLVIDLDGSFVEEVSLSPTVKAGLVKKKVWFIPVIKGVELSAILDVKNYTAFDFDAEISTTDRDGLVKGEVSRITSELEDMGKTASKAEYQESLSRLMERYTEVVSKDSDWVTLLEQKFLDQEKIVYGFCFGVKGHFVIQADMSIAIGSSLEYETGKRCIFWFKVGLFEPTSGSSVTDLIDERFGFQFYVMGKLGMRMGVKFKIYAGLGTADFASAGLTAEMGPYIKLWGFFIYTCNQYRPANSTQTAKEELMAGALDLELGMYFSVGYEATALWVFSYSDDFGSWEIPILHTGANEFAYDCFYRPEPDESVRFYNNTNSPDGSVMKISDYARTLKCIGLQDGYRYWDALPVDRFFYSLSNSNFHLDTSTGELLVTVTPPEGVHYMKCDLTVTYKGGKMAFSTYDMTTTVPLVWTDLSDRELKEYHTASVRVGNDADGYNTVWTKKVLLGEEFDLPDEAQIRELAGWNDLKYEAGTGYGEQALKNLVITQDTVYDYQTSLRSYSVTVTGIRGGGSSSKTYTAKFGETFDFSDLANTGGAFEKFTQVTTNAEITVDEQGGQQAMDLTRPIGPAMAQALQSGGVTAQANYVDDSVMAYFTFTGVDLEQIEVRTRRGTKPETEDVDRAVEEEGEKLGIPSLSVRDITPAVGPIDSDTHYDVDCVQLSGARAELRFESNGGTELNPMNRLAGSLVTGLPQPEKTGYAFGGWYQDSSCEGERVENLVMPQEDAVLYAKWASNTYTVSFHVNGGTSSTPDEIEVAYGGQYGDLPVVKKTGERFLGWFTAQTGGERVNSGDLVEITENQTLYAHWGELLTIGTNGNVFSVTPAASGLVYNKQDRGGEVSWTLDSEARDSEGNPGPTDGYEFEFGGGGVIATDGRPVNAGTYDLIITRPADDNYAYFREVHKAVITIQKANWETAVWNAGECQVKVFVSDDSYIEVQLEGDSGFMLDEVLAGTAPRCDIEGVWTAGSEGGLICRLLSFEGNPSYGDDCYQGLGNANLTGKTEFTITLYIPESRNYSAATVSGTYSRS